MKLNKEQSRAAEFSTGPSLVIAGAGTGKTKTLVQKTVNILTESTIKDYELLLLTFSRKAANEIRERLSAEAGYVTRIKAATFHSFSYSLLAENQDLFISQFGFTRMPDIILPEKKAGLAAELIGKDHRKFGGLPFQVILSSINDKSIVERIRDSDIQEELNILSEKYEKHKKMNNLIEFEEIINYTVSFLKNNVHIRKQYADRFKYILVDEFQDTSDNNFELLSLILNRDKNIFAVGDDFQLIYSFRNSRIKYILQLKKYFRGLKTYKLKTNYRSRKEIVSLSNRFIRNNKYQSRKKLKSHKGRGGLIRLLPYTDYDNALKVLIEICGQLDAGEESAVLYRNNFLEKHLEPAVMKFKNVKFMTIHSSKGLEFDNVIIFGVDDSIIPSPWSSIEEERRLFYVAMTRAKERLFIMYNESNAEKPLFIRELDI